MPARPAHPPAGGLARHRALIFTAIGILVVGGIALLIRAQLRAQEYEETFKKGMTLWNQKEAERALVPFRKAAQIDPRDPELWVMIGRCELVSGHGDRAPEAWEEALRRSPGYKPALFERGKELLGRHITRRVPPPADASTGWLSLRLESAERVEGGTQEAQRILADLRESAGNAPGYTSFARGAIFLMDGKYGEAQPGFQDYTQQNGWDATGFAMLGIAAHYGAQPKLAERALSDALSRHPEKAWLKVRADARFLQGNYAGAREDYREAGLEKEAEPLLTRRIPSQGQILWLRADTGVDVAGTTVTKWQDQSGGKNDGAPRDPAIGPQVSASALRGRPAILFAGKDDELWLPDGFEDFSAGLSAFVVGEPSTGTSDEWSFFLLATPARGAARIEAYLGRRRESEQIVYVAEDLQKQIKPFVEGVPPAKEFEAISAIQQPSGAVQVYKRGAPAAKGTLLLPRKTLRTRNRVGAGLKGRIAEVVVYNRSLSDLERLGVDAYLKEKYFPDAPSPEKR